MKPEGFVLIMVLAVMILLIGLVGGFLYATSILVLNSGWEETDAKVLWLAEAGLQKGIWNLKTPVGSGGQGETWTTAGTTENLGDGSYTMVVARWDFALSSNSATASASSSNGTNLPANAIDNSTTTFWESGSNVSSSVPGVITTTFPYTLTLNQVRFLVPSGSTANIPRDYTWQVSTDGSTFSTVVTVTGNSSTDVTNIFNATANVNYLRLRVTRTNTNNRRVRIATLEAIGSKITSTGTIITGGNTLTRTVVQTVVTDDASPQSQVAYIQPDWVEQ